MTARRTLATLAAAVGLAASASTASAAAPANDGPGGAVEFSVITAENGTPAERQGIAELVEATPDAGVARCLGADSFDRTVWFRVPSATVPRELSVEASGRTAVVLDIAAFVQPQGANAPVTAEANACAGVGSGAADASEEPTAGVGLRVPAGRTVLVQIGRRGARGSAVDERAVVSLNARALEAVPAPAGDVADAATPALAAGVTQVALGGATLTHEDPAQPPCPALGSVWRRVVPSSTGNLNVTAGGAQIGTLATFSGPLPTSDNVTGCVNRERPAGDLVLSVAATKGVPLWIRLGTDRPPADATGTIALDTGPPASDGGSGGGSPIGGNPPGGGAKPDGKRPSGSRCPALGRAPRSGRRDTRVGFSAVTGKATDRNRSRRLTVRIARLTGRRRSGRVVLVGPCKRIYARSAFVPLRTGQRITLTRIAGRKLAKGTYRLQVDVRRSTRGKRTYIPTTARFRLR